MLDPSRRKHLVLPMSDGDVLNIQDDKRFLFLVVDFVCLVLLWEFQGFGWWRLRFSAPLLIIISCPVFIYSWSFLHGNIVIHIYVKI